MKKMKVRFINFERTKLPEAILKHNLEEKRKYFAEIHLEDEKSDAEIQVLCGFVIISYCHRIYLVIELEALTFSEMA